MKVTLQEEYGLNCILSLAGEYGQRPLSVRQIAQRENVPRSFAEKLLGRLRHAHLIESVRGVKGGYTLAREPRQITVRQVMKALYDGETLKPPRFICRDRADGPNICTRLPQCGIRPLWIKASQLVNQLYEQTDLQFLLEQEQRVSERLGLR